MDISCALQFYYFILGERNDQIGKLKDFLRSLSYLTNKPSLGIIFDTNKPSLGIIFDNTLLLTLTEFQRSKHLQTTDGSFNDETYAALGKEMTPEQKRIVIYNDPQQGMLKWLLEGKPPTTSLSLTLSRKSHFEKSNGNAEDEAADKALAKLLTVNGIVKAASASGRGNAESDHFRISDGKVYTIHIYGDENGISVTGIYLPKFFHAPIFAGVDTVTATTNKGEVLGIAHVRVSSQTELDANYKLNKLNALGSRYIGETGGYNGDGHCYKHSHLHFYPNMAARLTIKNRKVDLRDPNISDSKFLLDVRDLLKK